MLLFLTDELQTDMPSPPGSPEKPPCECRVCIKSFRTLQQQKDTAFQYTKSLSNKEATWLAGLEWATIHREWKAICTLMDKHDGLIQGRWEMKTRLERYEILKVAMKSWGGELEQELILWPESPKTKAQLSTKALLLNYLTMNRLTAEPGSFLALLYGRRFHRPRQ
jgi:hypothetical protein